MDLNETGKKFSKIKNKYDKLGLNLVQALELLLKEQNIGCLSINHRVKDKTSFLEKIERKNYQEPFEQIEDICGIRIICYYQSDVKLISDLISKELDVIESQDKEEMLNSDQFGYRSTHFIVKINPNWLQAPNYRGLENLKAEIQVRTILMHAWAEIEHKLSYKSETQIPKQFKRKLFIMSAKLEEADEQFENLRNSILTYKEEVKEIASGKTEEIIPSNLELNLDSLQAFLDLNFANRKKDINDTAGLVDSFLNYNISLYDLISSYEKVKPYLPQIEKEIFKEDGKTKRGWSQTGIAREIMDLTNENWRENRGVPNDVVEFDRKWSEKIFGVKK